MSTTTITDLNAVEALPGLTLTATQGETRLTARVRSTIREGGSTGPVIAATLCGPVNRIDFIGPDPWTFVSATYPVPEYEPSTVGTAKVLDGSEERTVRGVWVRGKGGTYFTPFRAGSSGRNMFYGDTMLSFRPDAAGTVAPAPDGLVDRDPADYGDAPDDAPADSTVCLRCGRVALHHAAGRYSPFGVCPVTKVPSRDELADAMHDDHLPTGHPRLTHLQRLILADAVGELLRKGGA